MLLGDILYEQHAAEWLLCSDVIDRVNRIANKEEGRGSEVKLRDDPNGRMLSRVPFNHE